MSNYSIRRFALGIGRYLRFIGFGTFSLKDEKIYVSVSDFACLSFNLSVAFLVLYLSFCYGVERLMNKSFLLFLGSIITMMGGSLVAIASIVFVFWHRYRIWKLILILDDIAEKFKKIPIQPNFKPFAILFAAFAIISILLIILGLFIMAQWLGYSDQLGILIVYGYLSASFSASMGWSSMFHLAIYLRLKTVNVVIRDFSLSTKPGSTEKLKTPKEREKLVLTLKTIHYDIMRCVRLTNIIFSFQTMLCVGVTFLFTLFTLFTAFKTFYYKEVQLYNMSISTIYWCVFYNYFKGCIIYTCNLVDTEAETLAALTYKMMSRDVCSPMIMQAFGHQVKQISGKSTCGLFNFDYPLITMFVSAIATYLIILIQFESSLQSKAIKN